MSQNSVENKQQADIINHPAHYTKNNIECWVYLEDSMGEGFGYYLEGCVKKYLHRWRDKHSEPSKQLEDLKKANACLNALIKDQEHRTT